jgi:hypothetical protein
LRQWLKQAWRFARPCTANASTLVRAGDFKMECWEEAGVLSSSALPSQSFTNDDLAQLIVKLWTDNPTGFSDSLMKGTVAPRIANAQAALMALPNHPISLQNTIVITEAEYQAGWECDDDSQVVFVLPDAGRQTGSNLLEAAKLLIACVPNGINSVSREAETSSHRPRASVALFFPGMS